MPAVFEGGGLRFLYPENWRLEEEATEEGWSVTVQSPETAFLVVSIYPARPPVKEVLETALGALRENAPDMEVEDASESIAKHHAVGHDVRFFCLDLTNTCWTRSFRTNEHTVLILCQTNDTELDYAEPVLRAMRASLELIEDET